MLLHGCRSTSPHFWKSGSARAARGAPAPAPAPADPTLLTIRRACSLTSSWEMRPAGPVPCTSLTSTPISRARRRTEGAAGAAAPLRSARGGAAAAGGGGGSAACRGGIGTTLDWPTWSAALSWPGDGASAFAPDGASADKSGDFAFAADGAAADESADFAAAPAPLPLGSSTVRTMAPTVIFSPFLTRTSLTTPATDEGTSIVALSVSSSSTG